MGDIRSPFWLWFKCFAFLALGFLALMILTLRSLDWTVVAMSVMSTWAFARAYYFAFYVIENYIDSEYKFSGLSSAFRYWLASQRKK